MTATNKTENYQLPIYVASDKPTYLGDWNNTMNKLDAAIDEARDSGGTSTSLLSDMGVTTEEEAAAFGTKVQAAQSATQVSNAIETSLNGYATESWVNNKNFQSATQVQDIINQNVNGYQTAANVNSAINSALQPFNLDSCEWILNITSGTAGKAFNEMVAANETGVDGSTWHTYGTNITGFGVSPSTGQPAQDPQAVNKYISSFRDDTITLNTPENGTYGLIFLPTLQFNISNSNNNTLCSLGGTASALFSANNSHSCFSATGGGANTLYSYLGRGGSAGNIITANGSISLSGYIAYSQKATVTTTNKLWASLEIMVFGFTF